MFLSPINNHRNQSLCRHSCVKYSIRLNFTLWKSSISCLVISTQNLRFSANSESSVTGVSANIQLICAKISGLNRQISTAMFRKLEMVENREKTEYTRSLLRTPNFEKTFFLECSFLLWTNYLNFSHKSFNPLSANYFWWDMPLKVLEFYYSWSADSADSITNTFLFKEVNKINENNKNKKLYCVLETALKTRQCA